MCGIMGCCNFYFFYFFERRKVFGRLKFLFFSPPPAAKFKIKEFNTKKRTLQMVMFSVHDIL